MTQLISNVLMQPKPDAIERPLTLVEKLERVIIEHNAEFNKIIKDATDHQKVAHTAVLAGLLSAIKVAKQHSQETCNWRNNKGTGLWECHYGGDYTSDCGLEWNMSNKDSPNENEMHFCPKCGKKLVEAQPPSEVQA